MPSSVCFVDMQAGRREIVHAYGFARGVLEFGQPSFCVYHDGHTASNSIARVWYSYSWTACRMAKYWRPTIANTAFRAEVEKEQAHVHIVVSVRDAVQLVQQQAVVLGSSGGIKKGSDCIYN